LALAIVVVITFFTRTRLGGVTEIHPESLRAPRQHALSNAEPIRFVRGGYEYLARPVAAYTVSGLVVRRFDYGWWVIDRSESAFPLDLCLVWGGNLKRQVHREPSVRFSQDCRFCFARWSGNVKFDIEELSNNHVVVDKPAMEKQLKRIMIGDQIRLRGQLVNVEGRQLGAGGRYDSDRVTWQSSTTRTDTGGGACEVIYVEEVTVLRAANQVSRRLFRFALVGVVVLGAVLVGLWFRG